MHVFVDTNIFIRVATQGRPGCESERFEDLRTLVEGEAFTLLVPEVVLLEVTKKLSNLPRDVESNCDKLIDSVKKVIKGTWSEVESLTFDVLALIKNTKQLKIEGCVQLSRGIVDLLNSDFVTVIPLSPSIMVSAKRRQIAGKMPNCKSSADQDALIVESLVSYFGSHQSGGSLLFCTENTSDFALELSPEGLDRRFHLCPEIQASLPKAHFSTDLISLLSVVNGFEQLPRPTNDEIESALMSRDMLDIDDEGYFEAEQLVADVFNREYARQFCEDVQPSIPSEVQQIRSRIADDIVRILAQCRTCQSWGERSECKLPQWIDFIDEEMIPYAAIPRMVRIKKSLEEYLQVHLRMDFNNNSE